MPVIIEKHPELTIYVHGIRVKPGKPFIFAMIANKPIFVLPGNPTSAMMVCMRLVLPHLRRWNHLPKAGIRVVKATLDSRVYSELGRKELKAVTLTQNEAGTTVAIPNTKGSETITTLLNAHGYFEIPENVEIVEKGTIVEIKLF